MTDGDRVIPPQVDDNATVICPACEGKMSVVPSHKRGSAFVSRHFRHYDRKKGTKVTEASGQATLDQIGKTGKCPGESDQHLKMKSIAYARLENDFPEATTELESGVGDRIADVLVTFDEPRYPYGKGIAIEAQYRNKGKDVDAVTDHYLNQEYSVAWLREGDFTNYDVDLSGVLTLWPYALPDRSGLEGYPDVVRWLWQDRQPTVEREIPIPGEYWMSFDRSDEWVPVAERQLRQRGRAWATISRSPRGNLTFQLSKKERGYGGEIESVTVQAYPEDYDALHTFVERLQSDVFESKPPLRYKRDDPWHDVATAWFSGTDTVRAWLSVSYSPDNDIVLSLGKKHPKGTDRVSVQVDRLAVDALSEITDLLDRAFEIERS